MASMKYSLNNIPFEVKLCDTTSFLTIRSYEREWRVPSFNTKGFSRLIIDLSVENMNSDMTSKPDVVRCQCIDKEN